MPRPQPRANQPGTAPRALLATGPQYEFVDGAEDLASYCQGGYHPIAINDILYERYRVDHKLGYGGHSTTWLARDRIEPRYVAVKVGTADSSGQKEAGVLSELESRNSDAKPSLALVLDHFEISGPNGTHPCLVTLPARCSLARAKEMSRSGLFQLDVARFLTRQLVVPVAHVHQQGYVHGGVPSHVVLPAWLGTKSEEIKISEAQIILSDFGVSFDPSKESRFESYAPLEIRPPEARFEPLQPLSFASDIWSLGCGRSWAATPGVVGQVDGEDRQARDQRSSERGPLAWTWDQRFEDSIQEPRREKNMPTICEAEKADFFAMIRSMLAFRLEERPTAKQVVESHWMRKWAAPADRPLAWQSRLCC
ncbi:hypothetical protein CSOJ01_07493 [Colletotrichum sojae]|uniref:non-specific serine/threonine protein kinase n=1 Tax=Colletotrichum sojae TaxID=2175907 RepID=A0A8H6J8L0_9PEZI|nr:hypothetical protein CSOJ01_07493 [Colletotrichum sojae]